MLQLSKDEIFNLGKIDPDLESYLRDHPELQEDDVTLEQRKVTSAKIKEELRQRLGDPPSGIRRTSQPYKAFDGTELEAYLFQPDPLPQEGAPMVMLIHGGGFVVGAPESEEITSRNLVQNFGAVCYSISYRLAPEHQFPTAPSDCWDALKFVAANAESWGADPVKKGFIVGGVSAGGNLAAGLAHRARDEGLQPPLTGQWLGCAWLAPQEEMSDRYAQYHGSYEQNSSAPALPRSTIDMYRKAYEPDTHDDRFNVLGHSRGHKDIPRTYFQICGMDPFRDEDLTYEDILRSEHGINTKMDIYPGLPHGYWIFFPGLTEHIAKYRQDQIRGFGWLLNRESKEGSSAK